MEKLKFYRNRKFPDMGLRKVADEIDVSFSHLNKIERGLIPSKELIDKLVKAYDLSKEEEFELLVLAGRIFDHQIAKNFFEEHPKKLEELGEYFRKNKKDE